MTACYRLLAVLHLLARYCNAVLAGCCTTIRCCSVYTIFGGLKKQWPTLKTMAVLNWQTFPSDLPLDIWVDSYLPDPETNYNCIYNIFAIAPCFRSQFFPRSRYSDYGTSESFDKPTPKETLRQNWLASKNNHQFWWYWCIGPADPAAMNTFVERPAIQARLLYWLTALHAVNGMLYCMPQHC